MSFGRARPRVCACRCTRPEHGRALAGEADWDDDEDLIWEVREPVVLFDSAIPGAELEPDDLLVIDLDPGRYRVRATYTKDEDNWMILVHLQPTA
ncbi:Imm21 family immunity protein [Streptosporangium sp. NPDC000095]|uniref:Imm21 family immunity protein n=1 Tax=Streptosporangium sp. NPDC000095 TaxID=3366184 RepID=UPI003697721E